MRKVFLGLALFALTFYCHAQSNEIEELRKQIQEHTEQDTARVNLLIKISFSTPTIPIEEIEKNAAEALSLSRKLNYAEGEGFALALQSRLNLINRNMETSFAQLNQADSIAKKTKNLLLQYRVNFYFISYYNRINDYRQGLSYALQAEKAALQLGNLELIETSQRQIANSYTILGDYAQALDYSMKSVKNAEKLNSQTRLYNAWNALAQTYTLIGDYEKSNEYLQKLTDLHKQLDFGNEELKDLYNGLGENYRLNKKYPEAIEQYNLGLNISTTSIDSSLILSNLADVYVRMDNLPLAFQYGYQSLTKAKKSGNNTIDAWIFGILARAHVKQNRPDSALFYADQGYKLGVQTGYMEDIRDNAKVLADAYALKNDFRNAYDFYKTYISYRDSMTSAEVSNKASVLEYNFEIEKKEDEIALLSEQKKSQQNFLISALIVLGLILITVFLLLRNNRLKQKANLLLQQQKQEIDEKANELALKANELSAVNRVSNALASYSSLDEIIHLVGDQMKDLFKANIVYLAFLDKKTNMINFPYQYGEEMLPQKMGEGLTSKIISSGKPLLINKDIEEVTLQLGAKRIGIPSASYLGVPIFRDKEAIGVLSVQSTETENRFNESDSNLLSTIASSVGVAINKAQLFEEVVAAKKSAEQANEAKSAFLSTVSHELRTPLTSVLGFAKIIQKRLEEKIFPLIEQKDPKTEKTINQVSENLKVVISEGERLTTLINDVLDLAKIEAGKMDWSQEEVAMPEVVERAISATTTLFEQKNLKLIRDIDPNIPTITGDTNKLIQVVINLISNAVKFTDKGSVTCRIKQVGNEIITSILDTGMGIAKEDFGAVFEQFKQIGGDTLTDKPKGTGLGLPICKEIVEHSGGRIWVESEVGKGTTFSFAIPFVEKENLSTSAGPIHLNDLVKQLKEKMTFSKLKDVGANAHILIVDDEESIRSLLRQELTEAGYLTSEASNGKEAIESIRQHRPDLIILDIMMPEINGFDVAAILKNDPQTMDIPIIILSIVQDKARGFRIGVDRYLTKPIDTAQLFEDISALLEQGKSKRKVMVVDEDSAAIRTLTEVLQTKGYHVVESDGKELVEKAIANQPDIIILNSILSADEEIVQTLRFEKGLENVLFFIYQ
ncbi:GAF domain-containing protein [Aquiflexum balticum DSM 16537]|uniref:histidine kinase n=1 Tax=Aquiflexum balticum DSM 16537 TaxID=758820 RepID=A0A1W2H1A5_9BACT|nr:response regulator [Aquiflexum balticum]SMD42276.1 GAF domain-containing protein [Aquiflexum balticum DSM 16537]